MGDVHVYLTHIDPLKTQIEVLQWLEIRLFAENAKSISEVKHQLQPETDR